jgi:hypothetical protein
MRVITGLRGAATFCLCVALSACSTRDRQRAAKATQDVDSSALATQQPVADAVQRLFKVEASEKRFVDSSLLQIQQSQSPPGVPLSGELRRFDSGPGRRYLLAARIQDSSSHRPVIRFLVIEPGVAPVPSPILVADEIDRFAVDTIADFDHDGAADVGYCLWLGKRGAKGEWHLLSLLEGQWRVVKTTNKTIRSCEPQAEP